MAGTVNQNRPLSPLFECHHHLELKWCTICGPFLLPMVVPLLSTMMLTSGGKLKKRKHHMTGSPRAFLLGSITPSSVIQHLQDHELVRVDMCLFSN